MNEHRLDGVRGDARKAIESAEQEKRLARIRDHHGACRPSMCDQKFLLDHYLPMPAV